MMVPCSSLTERVRVSMLLDLRSKFYVCAAFICLIVDVFLYDLKR